MSLMLDVSADIEEELRQHANAHGQTIETLVENWLEADRIRDAAFNRVHALRQALFEQYGIQPDSVPLIREDRDR